jgi:hypothetical protein
MSSDVVRFTRDTHHVTRHNTPIHNILSTAPQLSISQRELLRTHAHTHTLLHTHTHTHIATYTRTHTHYYIHTHTHYYIHTHTHTLLHTPAHTHTLLNTHAHTHIATYTRTQQTNNKNQNRRPMIKTGDYNNKWECKRNTGSNKIQNSEIKICLTVLIYFLNKSETLSMPTQVTREPHLV